MNYRSNRTFTVELGTGQTLTQLLISLAMASYQMSRRGHSAFPFGLTIDPSDTLSIAEAADFVHEDGLRMLIARGEPCMTALKVVRHVGQTVELVVEMFEGDTEQLLALASIVMSDQFPSEEDELTDATEDAVLLSDDEFDDEITVEIVLEDRTVNVRPIDDDPSVEELVASLLADFEDVPTNPCIVRPHDEAVTR